MTSGTETVLQIKNCSSIRQGPCVITAGYLKHNQVYFFGRRIITPGITFHVGDYHCLHRQDMVHCAMMGTPVIS
jgi:hypothetical protein